MSSNRAILYVDGFNLYYGIRNCPGGKWLDLDHLARLVLPHYSVEQVKYFTARISAPPGDPSKPQRQAAYWRALRTLPNLEIIEGNFSSHPVSVRPISPVIPSISKVTIMKTEEKGSDVNLATHLLVDAFDRRFQTAIVISNISDLALPIETVVKRFGPVIVLNPHLKSPGRRLRLAASQFRPLRRGPVTASQFPMTLSDRYGIIHRPKGW